MTVRFDRKTLDFEGRLSAKELLKRMNLLPETVLVAKNGEIVTEDEMLGPDDSVEVIRAISGGAEDGPPVVSELIPPRKKLSDTHSHVATVQHPPSTPSPSRGEGKRKSQSAPLLPSPFQPSQPELLRRSRPTGEGAGGGELKPQDESAYRISIRDWPEGERPREKLLAQGADSLTDTELLAIMLRTGVKGLSALDLARRILTDFDGLSGLVNADAEDLRAMKGLGSAKVAQIMAALEMGRRAGVPSTVSATFVRSSKDVYSLVHPIVKDLKKEVLDVLFLNSKNRLLARERMGKGTVNRNAVFCREIVERGIKRSAAALILVHNHPSGDPAPSAEDENVTRDMVLAGELLNLCVLDHIVVGSHGFYSFADEGRIDKYRNQARAKR